MATKAESREAIDRLREMVSPGDEIHTILRHVTRSGMGRSISLVSGSDGVTKLDYLVARALNDRIDQNNSGIKIGGCGMDMGFALVYNLSRTLYPTGFGCIGEGCPSNDHSNGDRDYTPAHRLERCDCLDRPGFDGLGRVHARCNGTGYVETGNREHHHEDGGYALRHRWL